MNPKLFRIRPTPPADAPDDNVKIVTDKAELAKLGVNTADLQLDPFGIPTIDSLAAWHEKNNPHLFAKKKK